MPAVTRTPSVLMVAHGFPPAGGSGSNRALAFARYLPAFGWRPIVLTPAQAWAANRDDQLVAGIPGFVRVVRTRSREPRPSASASHGIPTGTPKPSVLRRHLGHAKRFPDAHIGWLPYAVAAARGLDFDVIYSSSGPFTSHVIGLLLRRLTGKPLVAELRDGWYRWNRAIFPDYPVWRDALERRLESAVIRAASRVVLVTERMAQAFRCQYADLPPGHFTVVSNGFDPAQFAHASEPSKAPASDILHTGALYYGRSLATFLDAAASLEPQPRLTLLGTLDATARDEITRHRFGPRIRILGQRDHQSTIDAMRRARVLLLVANTTEGAGATVPGKLFEYLAVGRPVLAVAPPDSTTADIMAETQAGWFAPGDDVDAIAHSLRSAMGGPPPQPGTQAVARYDRRVLAGTLARVFDEVRTAHRV